MFATCDFKSVRYACIGYLTEMYEMRTHCDTYEMPVGFY